jgi:hypothetical protein
VVFLTSLREEGAETLIRLGGLALLRQVSIGLSDRRALVMDSRHMCRVFSRTWIMDRLGTYLDTVLKAVELR